MEGEKLDLPAKPAEVTKSFSLQDSNEPLGRDAKGFLAALCGFAHPTCAWTTLGAFRLARRDSVKTIAKALIETAAVLAMSVDDVVHPDHAVRAVESIGNTLRSASPEELKALREALSELAAAERLGLARKDRLRFYADFWEGFGLPEDGA